MQNLIKQKINLFFRELYIKSLIMHSNRFFHKKIIILIDDKFFFQLVNNDN